VKKVPISKEEYVNKRFGTEMDEKMNIMPQYPIPSYKYGGIHIKKKNRGKFTKSAKAAGQSVQEHAHSVMNNPKASTL
jgi:hypothetical protein